MSDAVTKGIDLGIVTADPGPMLDFYRSVLGLEHIGVMEMPGRMVMHRFRCGASTVKVIDASARTFGDPNLSRGITGSTGLRYFTISVVNLDERVTRCAEAGAPVVVPAQETRPGARIAIVEDPDGNWVEFLEEA